MFFQDDLSSSSILLQSFIRQSVSIVLFLSMAEQYSMTWINKIIWSYLKRFKLSESFIEGHLYHSIKAPMNKAASLIARSSLIGWLVKNPPTIQDTRGQSLGWEDPLVKGKATHSSILENSMDNVVHGISKSWTQLSNFHSLTHWFFKLWKRNTQIYLEKKIFFVQISHSMNEQLN